MTGSSDKSDHSAASILIVDDENSIQRLFSRILSGEGFGVALANDGQEALQLLEENEYDIVITDIVMPHVDGFELARQINDKYSADVIVTTGHIDKYHYSDLVGLGASDFIQKPVFPDDLILRVNRVLKERQLRYELVQYHKELAHSQKFESIGLLAAGIAHEINTPIQYIGDNTAFLQDAFSDLAELGQKFRQTLETAAKGDLDPAFIEKMENAIDDVDLDYLAEEIPVAVGQTLEGVDRVRKIVRSMKEFSHPGGEKGLIDIHHTIENTVTVALNEWKYCAELNLDFAPDIPRINCDASEMSQVFLNLIINATHAIAEKIGSDGSEKGRILIQTQKKEPWVEIRVSDTGTGIPQEMIDKVFDPFFTTKEVGKGTGQGLAISRSVVVDRHQGRLDIDSRPGEGTTFIIRLPLVQPA